MANISEILGQNEQLQGDENVTVIRRKVSFSSVPDDIRMEVEQKKLDMAEKSGNKSKKDIAWDAFLESELKFHDPLIASKNLDNYLRICDSSIDLVSIHAELFGIFQNFLDGKNGLPKNLTYAENVLLHMKRTRDAAQLMEITSYYEKRNRKPEAEGFYFTLYDIYAHGEGVLPDANKAITYLKNSIDGNNTAEKRSYLRDMYQQQDSERDGEKKICNAYEKVINDGIEGSKTEYADYLVANGKKENAIHWYVADGKYKEAYFAVNILAKDKLSKAVKEFKAIEEAKKSSFGKSLQRMLNDFSGLQSLMHCTKEPCRYGSLAFCYTLPQFNIFYALYKTYKASQVALAVGIVIMMSVGSVALFFHDIWKALLIIPLVWTLIMFFVDIYRRYIYLKACKLWVKLEPHPALKKREQIFSDSKNIIKKSQHEWAVVIPVMILFLTTGLIAALPADALMAATALKDMASPNNSTRTESTQETARPSPTRLDNVDIKIQENEFPEFLSHQETELSLGGIDVGADKKHVYDILGKEVSSSQNGKVLVLKYNHVDIHLESGKVVNILSNTEFALTKKHAHQGMLLQDVLNLYGVNFSKSSYDGKDLYEYFFTTPLCDNGVLRFAIDPANNTVKYIGARSIDDEFHAVQANKSTALGEHWIKDDRTDVYLWNPQPSDGESVTWSGRYIEDGGYKYADGKGVIRWYQHGKMIQIDEGSLSHGRYHGKFMHKFLPSEKIVYSNWDHGKEIE